MSYPEARGKILALLSILLFAAPAITILAWLDATQWYYVLNPTVQAVPSESGQPIQPENLQRLKQSILRVQVAPCEGKVWSTGTSFVVAPGYVATAAHVVSNNQACGAEMTLVDHRGLKHVAQLAAFSDRTQLDLALLSFGEEELSPLSLADSTQYESGANAVDVVTIGYPPGVSTEEEAAPSESGLIANYRNFRFFTSGMDLNPGNSGGPVFLMSDWTVLGIALKKGDSAQGGEGLGVVVASSALAEFFKERIGQSL